MQENSRKKSWVTEATIDNMCQHSGSVDKAQHPETGMGAGQRRLEVLRLALYGKNRLALHGRSD